jgi:hypothetical protein
MFKRLITAAAGVGVALLGVTGAGVLAAGPASASTPVHNAGSYQNFFTGTTLPHYLGVPNKIYAGQAALLKPAVNKTTTFVHMDANSGAPQTELTIKGLNGTTLALTSRATYPGATVTLESAHAYASQMWTWQAVNGGYTFRNVKTGMYLRVRNSGPIMYQTVTTGSTPTAWAQSS